MGLVVSDLERQLERLEVDVRLDTELTASGAEAFGADGVLVATGATADRRGYTPLMPTARRLEGVDLPHVITGFDLLAGAACPSGRVVVLDDQGTRYAAAVAEVLVELGCEVTLVTPFSSALPQTALTQDQPLIYARLLGAGLQTHLNSWARRVEPDGVVVVDLYTDTEHRLEDVAAVVLVTQRRAEDRLYRALAATSLEPRRIGDCLAPRTLDHAIFDGFIAGAEVDRSKLGAGRLERHAGVPRTVSR
jgi:hypothetical protein